VQSIKLSIVAISTVLLAACGGGSSEPAIATPSPAAAAPTPTPTPSPTPAPSPTPSPSPSPLTCAAPAIGSTGYSLVFRGCDAANVPLFYDKSECVRDNATGLIWEGKTTSGLRASTNRYSNFDNTSELQKLNLGGTGPTYVAPTSTEVYGGTNSLGYQNAVNANNLCGIGNWHMPTKEQLRTLVKPSEFPMIDNLWFPNMPAVSNINVYWTASPYLGVISGAWYVYFDRASAGGYYERYVHQYIRLVY
jgi:Protein of unknown function (DUF1566)